MIVPEREKGVRSFRIPRVLFHALFFTGVITVILLGIFSYDYYKILKQVYENKYLTIENRQLKEQIQLFNMKINALTEDIERIQTFEKKLRTITGIEQVDMTKPFQDLMDGDKKPTDANKVELEKDTTFVSPLKEFKDFQDSPNYLNLKNLYEQKIATNFGLQTGYTFTKELTDLTKQSFILASQYATFDYKFNILRRYVKNLETSVHELDQFLLDKDSYLKSTPTLLPTKGWITSYYGPRISPTSNRLKMHEGIDIGAKPGTAILAPADGVVVYSGTKPGFGMFVQLDHGYGVETIFAHAKALFAKKGQLVKRGTEIASIGSTGYSTGPHVHYEVRVNGTPVDPLYFILD
tara:strand:- start:10353 stop:11405 length:1053 start_codon:yes stop_codon:yes gene_type:complete